MKNSTTKTGRGEPMKSEGVEDTCELSLSADKEWVRLVVAGKQVATFHVNYVRKVLGAIETSSSSKSSGKKLDAPVLRQDL